MQPSHESRDAAAPLVSRIIFWVLAAVAAFYLLTEHRAHLFGALPFLLLLACPLMHFFHHRGHGHGGDHGHDPQRTPRDPPPDRTPP